MSMPMTHAEIEKCRTARHLLPPPGDEVVGRLIATIDRYEAAVAVLRGRIEMYRGNCKAHAAACTSSEADVRVVFARLDTAEVILDDFLRGGR